VTFDHLIFAVRDGVAYLTLNRPDKRNAISAGRGGTRDQIRDALDLAASDASVGSVLLSGAGGTFSAGGDLTGNVHRESLEEHRVFLEQAEAFHAAVRACPLPTVAAVSGYCLGAGLALATSCDFVIAGENAKFGMPEGRIGLVGGTSLVASIGRQWAKYLMLTGEILTAAQAQAIGLVLAVVREGSLEERARSLAEQLARMPRRATALNKRAIDRYADAAGDQAGRISALASDAETLTHADEAAAPDGRRFREILTEDGLAAMLAARDQQYRVGWLKASSADH
jgi:enoyl-CoA hydratase/carnithine racemase